MSLNKTRSCHLSFCIHRKPQPVCGAARYYLLRQNLQVLIDTLVRGLSIYGAPKGLYLDNARVYHSRGLKRACYQIHTRPIHRPEGDPSPGGIIEWLFLNVFGKSDPYVRPPAIISGKSCRRQTCQAAERLPTGPGTAFCRRTWRQKG